MSKKDIMVVRNNNARKVEASNRCGSHRNCVRLSTSNTIEHEMEKAKVCYELLSDGFEFITEAKFTNGKRADIYVLDSDLAIEIVKSESAESILSKRKEYPCDILVVRVGETINYI